jgi:hypothetical protein
VRSLPPERCSGYPAFVIGPQASGAAVGRFDRVRKLVGGKVDMRRNLPGRTGAVEQGHRRLKLLEGGIEQGSSSLGVGVHSDPFLHGG